MLVGYNLSGKSEVLEYEKEERSCGISLWSEYEVHKGIKSTYLGGELFYWN